MPPWVRPEQAQVDPQGQERALRYTVPAQLMGQARQALRFLVDRPMTGFASAEAAELVWQPPLKMPLALTSPWRLVAHSPMAVCVDQVQSVWA